MKAIRYRFTLISACCFSTLVLSSQAELILNISGVAGGTSTTWTFSGSALWTGTESGQHSFPVGTVAPVGTANDFKNADDFFSSTVDFTSTDITGTATITVNGYAGPNTIDEIGIDAKGGQDGLAFSVDSEDLTSVSYTHLTLPTICSV